MTRKEKSKASHKLRRKKKNTRKLIVEHAVEFYTQKSKLFCGYLRLIFIAKQQVTGKEIKIFAFNN